jgi:hypothetical protein
VQLPTPAAILGGLDPNAPPPEDNVIQGRVGCLRETTAHSDFLVQFAQTVVMKDVYRAKHTTGLLETFMGPNLEAFAVLTYTNNYDRWKEQCEIAALPEEERANRRPVAVRRFTEGARGGGKYRGWDETGIRMYNDLATRIKQQAGNWDLQSFEIDLKNKFRQAANINDNAAGQEDGVNGINNGLRDAAEEMFSDGEESDAEDDGASGGVPPPAAGAAAGSPEGGNGGAGAAEVGGVV